MVTGMLPRALVMAATLGLATSAAAQCQNPKTDAERAQCLGDELRGADGTINRVYGDLAKSLPAADRITLRNEQRAWLRTRDRTCGIATSQGDRNAWFAALLRDYQKTVCVVRLTSERVTALNGYQKANAIAPAPPPAPVAAPATASAASAAPIAGAAPVYDIVSAEPKAQGKWYFEVKIDPAGVLKSAEAAIFVGVSPMSDDRAINAGGSSVGTLQAIRRIDKDLSPKQFGFAVDLDNGRVYLSESGAWDDGGPGSAGGMALIQGRSYRMMLTSSVAVNDFLRSGALTVNLGEKGFVYSVPPGYRPLQPR